MALLLICLLVVQPSRLSSNYQNERSKCYGGAKL